MYEPIAHIPLLIWGPGIEQRVDITTPTSCVDILPTLLHLAGEQIPDWAEGEILPTMSNEDDRSNRSVYIIDAKENHSLKPLETGTVALVKGKYKLVHYFGYEGLLDAYELFDLENDPQEMVDLFPTHIEISNELRQELKEKLGQVNRPFL
ncbi:sulfatase/phosphatase domain-containing protein, partial [Chloroflexota bacterium]